MLIKGKDLNKDQRQQVLNAFGYRFTIENNQRALEWSKLEFPPNGINLQTDQDWLNEHAFHFTKNGKRLMLNRKHAEPAFLAD